MKSKDILDLDFRGLYSLQNISLIPEKVAIFNTLRELDLELHPHSVQAVALVLVKNGECTIEINLNEYKLVKNCMLIIVPNQIVQIKNISKDFDFVCLAVSHELIDELSYRIDNISLFIMKFKDTPFWLINEDNKDNILGTIEFLKNKLEVNKGKIYWKNILENMLLVIFYECLNIIENKRCRQDYSRPRELFDQFINLLSENHRKEHNVQFYSDALFVSPKYLSAIVNSFSSKSAKRWIDEFIILDAKVMLKSTKKPIQEIAYSLGFSDMSFFGKYFKRMTGVSPQNYRKEDS